MTKHNGPLIGSRDELKVIDCHECGFAHLDLLPDTEAQDLFYASDFWTKYKAGALAQFEIERSWWDALHGDWLSLVEKHCRPDELFDVGCGYGYFLNAAQKNGWGISGTEPSHAARAYAEAHLNVPILPYAIGDQRLNAQRKVDCISALWLVEHLPNPHDFLLWCYDHLLSGGVLLAVVPSDFSAIQTQANRIVKNKNWFFDKTHLNYFTWSSFSNLLGRSGFRIVERTTLFPMEQYLLDGLDYTANDEIGKLCHRRVRQSDLMMNRIDRINDYQAMAREERGREIVCIAIKE